MRHNSTYGWRAKIGLIVPPTNTVNEAEWARMMPLGVTFHTQRMPLHEDVTSAAGRRRLDYDLDAAHAMLKPAAPDVIAYACTAGSMVHPVTALPESLAHRNGVASVTTSAAIVTALRALGATSLSVATPYADALNAHEADFLRRNGFEVARIAGLGIGAAGAHEYPKIATTPIETVRAHALAAFVPGSDALVLLCTDLPTLPLVADLEGALGVPVVTSNQATFWAALRAAGIADRPTGLGRLLAQPGTNEASTRMDIASHG